MELLLFHFIFEVSLKGKETKRTTSGDFVCLAAQLLEFELMLPFCEPFQKASYYLLLPKQAADRD